MKIRRNLIFVMLKLVELSAVLGIPLLTAKIVGPNFLFSYIDSFWQMWFAGLVTIFVFVIVLFSVITLGFLFYGLVLQNLEWSKKIADKLTYKKENP